MAMDADTKREIEGLHSRINMMNAELQPVIKWVRELQAGAATTGELYEIEDRLAALEQAFSQFGASE